MVELPFEATETSLSLQWSPAEDNVAVTGYQLTLNDTMARTSTDALVTLGGLTPLTEYTVVIVAVGRGWQYQRESERNADDPWNGYQCPSR